MFNVSKLMDNFFNFIVSNPPEWVYVWIAVMFVLVACMTNLALVVIVSAVRSPVILANQIRRDLKNAEDFKRSILGERE